MAQKHVIKVSKKTLAEMNTVYQSNRLNKTVPYTV
ncbi:ribonuclease HIII, partial [Enterococcus faecalis]